MADKDAKKKKKKLPWSLKFLIFMLLVGAVVFLPSSIIFFGCMLPTFVAAVVDNQKQKTLWVTVGAMNLAGTVPVWFKLWEHGHNVDNAIGLMLSPETLMVAYSMAAAGWIISYNVTPLVANVIQRRGENRLKSIEKRRKELIRKWGEDVSTDTPLH